jgi:hypothetical protein
MAVRLSRNPLVSDETEMYGYESSPTLITDRLQTRPLVREGASTQKANVRQKKKKNLVMGRKGVPDSKIDRPTDRRSQYQLSSKRCVGAMVPNTSNLPSAPSGIFVSPRHTAISACQPSPTRLQLHHLDLRTGSCTFVSLLPSRHGNQHGVDVHIERRETDAAARARSVQ